MHSLNDLKNKCFGNVKNVRAVKFLVQGSLFGTVAVKCLIIPEATLAYYN